jgi:hypothetical protein
VSGRHLAELVIGAKFADVTGSYVNHDAVEESSALSKDAGNARELWDVSARLSGLADGF